MARQERWYFTKEELESSPSRRCGIDSEKELFYRQQAANLIQDMGQKLKVTQLVINTAIVYMHRFYTFHSFSRFHRNAISPCALFLAAKVEEQPRKLEHIIKVSQICIYRDNMDSKSEKYQSLAAQLVYNENLMLRTLGFDLNIQHSHTSIVNCCQLVRATKYIAETSYYLATNSLHLSTLCLQYKPTVVACICIYFVCKWSNFQFPKSSEGKDWWTYVDETVNKEMLEQLMSECVAIFQKCPQRLKKCLTDNVRMNSMNNSPSNNNNNNNNSNNIHNKMHLNSQRMKHFSAGTAPPSIPPKPATATATTSSSTFPSSSVPSATVSASIAKDKSVLRMEKDISNSLFHVNENSQNSLNHSLNSMNASSMALNFDLNSLNHTLDSSSLLNLDSDSLNHTFDASSLNADADSNHTMDASFPTDSISFNHHSVEATSIAETDAISPEQPGEAPASTLTTETADDSSDHSKKHKKKHKHKEKHKHKDKHKHKHKGKDKEKDKEKHREKYNVEPSFQIEQQPETGSKVAPLKLKILTKRQKDEFGDTTPGEDEEKLQPLKIKINLNNHQRSSPESPILDVPPVSRKRKRNEKVNLKKALKLALDDLDANMD